MKTISILRHAKSNWDYPELSDFDRPLLNKGLKRTILVCKALRENKCKPDLILSSPAARATETVSIVSNDLDIDKEKIKIEKSFYPGCVKTFIEVISKINNEQMHLMLVAHNPGLTDLASFFLPNENIDWIPTSGYVQIEFDCNYWNNISFKNATLKKYLIPKELKNK